MSTSFIYHALGLRDQNFKRIRFAGGTVIIEVFPESKAIKCPEFNCRTITKRGIIKRDIKTIPMGSKPVILRAFIQRVWCSVCKFVRQTELLFSKKSKTYTRAFERYVLDLSQSMTIKDIVNYFHISRDTIKGIQKTNLKIRYKSINLKKIKAVSIDMFPAYLSAVHGNLPGATIVFDKFHVVKLFNEKP